LASVGVTSVQASLASDEIPTMAARAQALATWRVQGVAGGAELLGVHLEGPFLAAAQCGAHDPARLRSPSPQDVEALVAARPTMVTLAPELPGALAAIHRFAGAGAVVAAGHSDAIGPELIAAVDAGLSHITHLWSGQSSTTRSGPWRVPGLLEESLASQSLTAEVIADGKHLPPALLEIARRCLSDRLIMVSDATSGAGMPAGFRYPLAAVECEVRDGVGMVLGADSFGGSTTTLPGMLRYLHQGLGWPLEEVLAMGTSRPARVAGLQHRKGAIAAGLDADLMVLDEDLQATSVLLRGVPVPCSPG
ncbi:MAG: N-acetylglucosamine-6-phosphate deacetylase, partial [Dermabacteraceae bacterium]